MKPEKLWIDSEAAREKLLQGVLKLARAVGVTYGPLGRSVVLEQEWAPSTFTRDGVTVAKSVELEDPLENLGSQLLRHAALRTAEVAGDGTTTSILLGAHLVRHGFRWLGAGATPSGLLEGSKGAETKVRQALATLRLEPSPKRLFALARSVSRSPEIAELIVEALEKAGPLGEVAVEEGPASETRLLVEAHAFKVAGWHPNLQGQGEWTEALVLVGERFENPRFLKDLWPFPALFLIGRISPAVEEALMRLRQQGACVAASFPPGMGMGHGEALRWFLEDVAILTGGEVYGGYGIPNPGKATVRFQGDRVCLVPQDLTPLGEHLAQVRLRLSQEGSSHRKTLLRKRLAFLAHPLVRLQVGGVTAEAMREAAFRFEDALQAVKGAREQGLLPGGGSSLIYAAKVLGNEMAEQVLREALLDTVAHLYQNAGWDPGVAKAHLLQAPRGYLLDLQDLSPVDAEAVGVMDSYLAVESAITSALDVARTLWLAQGILVEKEAFWR